MERLAEVFRDGGPVMWPILAASVLAYALALVYWRRSGDVLRELRNLRRRLETDPGHAGDEEPGLGPLTAALKLLSALIAALPLLGLLGTVLGMLDTFEVIRGYGTGEPRLMASGIRAALITTEAGLLTALPVLVLHRIIAGRVRRSEGERELIRHRRAEES